MLENIKSFASKTVFFVTNCLAALVIVFLIKEDAQKDQTLVTDEETSFTPVDETVSEKQSQIVAERENRLRQLNNTPKEIKQEAITTTTTTKTPDPTPTNNNSNPTVTSSKSSSATTTKKTTTTTTQPKASKKTKTS